MIAFAQQDRLCVCDSVLAMPLYWTRVYLSLQSRKHPQLIEVAVNLPGYWEKDQLQVARWTLHRDKLTGEILGGTVQFSRGPQGAFHLEVLGQ